MRKIKYFVPRPIRSWLNRRREAARVGMLVFDRVTNWAVLRRVRPYRREFGSARGECIDRFYIEKFLKENASLIQGSVAEIGSDHYTRLFGDDRVSKSDVLDLNDKNDKRTIAIDLTETDRAPSETFDCIICTQTIFEIFDYTAAIRSLHKMLRTNGVLLATVPGISQSVRGRMLGGAGEDWWRFTAQSAARVFGDVFGERNVLVKSYGNVLTAVAMLHGLVQAELLPEELEFHDPDYEVTISVKAIKEVEK